MILKNAPHPNAAQLLVNYMVTKEGTAAVQHLAGAVIPGAPETIYVPPRSSEPRELHAREDRCLPGTLEGAVPAVENQSGSGRRRPLPFSSRRRVILGCPT